MRTETKGPSERSCFDLAQRAALWLRAIRKLKGLPLVRSSLTA